MTVPNRFSSFGINYEFLQKKIQENHSHAHKSKTDDSYLEMITKDNSSPRDFVRFCLHSTSDVIE